MDSNGDNVYEVQVTADDGSGLSTTQSITVTVTDAREAPQLVLGGPDVTWIKKQPPVTVLPQLAVGQSADLGGGTLTIEMVANGTRKKSRDQLTVPATSSLGTSAGVQYANGKLTLQISLSPNATANAIESFLREVKFFTKGGGLKAATRTVLVTLTDVHGLSGTLSQTIHVRKKA